MNVSIQAIKSRPARILLLAVLLIHSFTSHSAQKSTPGLTKEAQKLFDTIQYKSDKLFAVMTEQTPTGATRSVSFKTLQERKSRQDPLLSGVHTAQVGIALEGWVEAIEKSLYYITNNAASDATLQRAWDAYIKVVRKVPQAILKPYVKAKEQGSWLTEIVARQKALISNKRIQDYEKEMHQARMALAKLQYDKRTPRKTEKESTRVLLMNLIDLLGRNIQTLRKRIFELDKELNAPQAQQVLQSPAQEQRPHELPARPQEPLPKAEQVRSQEEGVKTRNFTPLSPKRQ